MCLSDFIGLTQRDRACHPAALSVPKHQVQPKPSYTTAPAAVLAWRLFDKLWKLIKASC
jgi:hypothetical protein